MELRTALKFSAAGHGALVLWALVAGWFSADFDEAMEVTEVTLISGAEFAALVDRSGAGAPSAPVAPLPRPDPETAPEPDPEPLTESAPEQVLEQSEAQELAEEPGDTPVQAARVAPRAAEAAEPNVEVAPEVREAAQPVEAQEAAEPAEVVEETAPEAATTRIVTEATETGGAQEIALAPTATPRPRVRPERLEPTPEPVAQPEPIVEPEPETPPADLEDAISGALAAVAGGGAATGDPGPPITAGERDALRLAVQECWVVDVGSESADVTVTLGMSMTPEGRVADGTLRMVSASGGSEAAVTTAFNAARRAILRCQRDGYDLPPEKYLQWQEIEMVFSPSEMRIR